MGKLVRLAESRNLTIIQSSDSVALTLFVSHPLRRQAANGKQLHDRGVIGALNRAARYLRMRRGGAGKVFYFLDNIEWSIDADVQLELSKVADTSLIWVRVPGTRISVTCANATATLVKQEQNSLPPNAGFPNAPSSQQVFSGGQTAHAQQPQLPHQSEGVPNQRAIVTMGPTGPPQVQGSHPAIECLQS